MAGKKAAIEGGKARAAQSQRAKFKYRSIKKIHRKRIIEEKRLQLEAEHYQHHIEIEVLVLMNEGEEDPEKDKARADEIDQRETRMTEIEKQVALYNDKLLDEIEDEDDEQEEGDG